MKYWVHWYDHTQIIKTDTAPIEAPNEVEGTKKAWERYNGNPPASVCFLEEIKE